MEGEPSKVVADEFKKYARRLVKDLELKGTIRMAVEGMDTVCQLPCGRPRPGHPLCAGSAVCAAGAIAREGGDTPRVAVRRLM